MTDAHVAETSTIAACFACPLPGSCYVWHAYTRFLDYFLVSSFPLVDTAPMDDCVLLRTTFEFMALAAHDSMALTRPLDLLDAVCFV